MKDLDFDELDQAVSSVLGTDTPSAEPKVVEQPAATPAPVAPLTTTAPVPADAPTPTEAATPPKATAASPAVRRRGQFLDMVHPTSKMTAQNADSAPLAPRKKISPVSQNVAPQALATPAVTAPTPSATTTSSSSTPPVVSESTNTSFTPPASTWPDPLDLMPAAGEADAKEPPAPASTPEVSEPESATTPFVTDAKVDKRPLDAFTASETPAETKDSDKNAELTKPETPAATTPDAPELPKLDDETKDEKSKPPIIDTTPPELQPDVVSVESDAGNELVDPAVVDEADAPPVITVTPVVGADTALTQSISQQYKTPTEATDQAPHPIFDTQEYHQPLLPAKSKKNRSGLIIIIIVLLLVVGAALGYFAFMAGL